MSCRPCPLGHFVTYLPTCAHSAGPVDPISVSGPLMSSSSGPALVVSILHCQVSLADSAAASSLVLSPALLAVSMVSEVRAEQTSPGHAVCLTSMPWVVCSRHPIIPLGKWKLPEVTQAGGWSVFNRGLQGEKPRPVAFADFRRYPPSRSLCLPASRPAWTCSGRVRSLPAPGRGPRTDRQTHSGSGSRSAVGHTTLVKFSSWEGALFP